MNNLVILYGTSHLLQNKPPIGFSLNQLDLFSHGKLCYTRDLVHLVCEFEIEVICEEGIDCWPSIAREVAHIGTRRHTLIDIPIEEQKRMGLNDDLGQPTLDMTKPENKAKANVRERYMMGRIKEYLGDDTKMLVVCGHYHLGGLHGLLKAEGIHVLVDSSVRKAWWRAEYVKGNWMDVPETSPELGSI